MNRKPPIAAVCLALGILTAALYWPITRHGFVNLDDATYVYQNQHIQSGLTGSTLAWAFTSGYASNWHPLTWISHMLDWQWFGANAGGHHFTSLLLHALNSILLFLLLRRLTGAYWRSALVAALFAWHPTHVESVAWAAERKDVLSAFFFLLSLDAYARYATTKPQSAVDNAHGMRRWLPGLNARRTCFYGLALLWFCFGLMSKPMVVTLPCVLLLLDFWPLRRFQLSSNNAAEPERAGVRWLLLEKVPFFTLSIAGSVVTYLAQSSGGAVASLTYIPLDLRLENALMAYARYLGKTFWPEGLCVFYPLPDVWPWMAVIGAALLLLAVSFLVARETGRRPYLFVGWFWFLGMLVPTIGLVQVGSQAMADRYLYLPSLGLFVAAAWGLNELKQAWLRCRKPVWAVYGAAAMGVLACIVCTSIQIGYWQNEYTLFSHAANAEPDNYLAYDHLAQVCEKEGRKADAEGYYEALLRLKPRYTEGQYNLGTLEMELGKLDAAAQYLTTALEIRPGFAAAHLNLGLTRFRQHRLAEASDELEIAARLAPHNPDAHLNLGAVYLALDRPVEATRCISRAVALEPDNSDSHLLLALAFKSQQKHGEAIAEAEQARALAKSVGNLETAAKADALVKDCQAVAVHSAL